jgi:hypothetical protein
VSPIALFDKVTLSLTDVMENATVEFLSPTLKPIEIPLELNLGRRRRTFDSTNLRLRLFVQKHDYLFDKKKENFSHELYFPGGSDRWIITTAGEGVGARNGFFKMGFSIVFLSGPCKCIYISMITLKATMITSLRI